MGVKVRNRRINNPSHVRQLMAETINELRNNDELDPIEKARAIGYLSNILLSAYRDGEATEKINKIMEKLEIE